MVRKEGGLIGGKMATGIFCGAVVFIHLAILSIISPAAGDPPEEVWIIGNPSGLVIFDRYQQRLTHSESLALPHYGPWWILNKEYLLSDNFTRTVKAEFENNLYFLQLTDDEDLFNQAAAGVLEKIEPTEIYHDTLRIISEKLAMLQPDGSELFLQKDDLAYRIFRVRNRLFIKDPGSGSYGWIQEKKDAGWVIYHPPSTAEAYEQFLFGRVDRIVRDYNTRLRRLVEYLNTRYNKRKDPPQWVKQQSSAGLSYRFGSGMEYPNFEKSRDYLVQELKDLLHGTGYDIHIDGNILAINKTT